MNKYLKHLLFVLIVSGLICCAHTNSPNRPAFHPSDAARESAGEANSEYILQLGDVIDIKFFYNPELNERVTIRPDGRISLQLVEKIEAAGLTPSELDGILTTKYSELLQKPEVAVIVKEFAGQNVYVGGEVNFPGLIPISGKLTSLQAIFQAGGFKNTAKLKSIVILRAQGTKKPLFMTINLKEDLLKHTQHNDILLKPYDVVFVPKTTIAKINQFVDQYLKKLIPVTTTLGFSYVLWLEKK
jgi:protein involved in polysaccharide export with SLBB domain